MYENDTFYHLSLLDRAGLVFLSVILFSIIAYLSIKLTSNLKLPAKIISALFIFWLFVWVSPQIYYFYYLLIFENLPLQVVIQAPPDPFEIFQIISFTGKPDLSAHSKGIFFWLIMLLMLIQSAIKRHSCTFRK